MVRERDQTFVAAAVVPLESQSWQPCAQTFIQDAFKVFCWCILGSIRLGIIVVIRSLEKICRRQLLWISDDNNLLPARDCPNGVPNGYLRSLIEDNHIEARMCRIEILSNRQWR